MLKTISPHNSKPINMGISPLKCATMELQHFLIHLDKPEQLLNKANSLHTIYNQIRIEFSKILDARYSNALFFQPYLNSKEQYDESLINCLDKVKLSHFINISYPNECYRRDDGCIKTVERFRKNYIHFEKQNMNALEIWLSIHIINATSAAEVFLLRLTKENNTRSQGLQQKDFDNWLDLGFQVVIDLTEELLDHLSRYDQTFTYKSKHTTDYEQKIAKEDSLNLKNNFKDVIKENFSEQINEKSKENVNENVSSEKEVTDDELNVYILIEKMEAIQEEFAQINSKENIKTPKIAANANASTITTNSDSSKILTESESSKISNNTETSKISFNENFITSITQSFTHYITDSSAFKLDFSKILTPLWMLLTKITAAYPFQKENENLIITDFKNSDFKININENISGDEENKFNLTNSQKMKI